VTSASVFSALAVSRPSLTEYLERMNVRGQKAERWHAWNHLSANDPTSSFFVLRCSKS